MPFGQFKEEKLMQLGGFFGRETEISFVKKILATDELRSHVTIPLGESHAMIWLWKLTKTSADWIDFFHQESKAKVSFLFNENR